MVRISPSVSFHVKLMSWRQDSTKDARSVSIASCVAGSTCHETCRISMLVEQHSAAGWQNAVQTTTLAALTQDQIIDWARQSGLGVERTWSDLAGHTAAPGEGPDRVVLLRRS